MDIVEIRDANSADLALFYEVPRRVYENDPVWIQASEQFVGSCILNNPQKMIPVVVTNHDKPVARAVAIQASERMTKSKIFNGYIGFFECFEGEDEAAHAVLARCESILKSWGTAKILAPKADNFLYGLQVSEFHLPHTILTNHNPPYYRDFFTNNGYKVIQRIRTFLFSRSTVSFNKVSVDGVNTRAFAREQLDTEIYHFHTVQQTIFAERFGYTSRTLEDDRALVKSLLPYLDDDLVIIAESDTQDVVGLIICIPDIYQRYSEPDITRARIVSIGVIPSIIRQGVATAMGNHLMQSLIDKGYQQVEGSLVLSWNLGPQILARRFGAVQGRKFELFAKDIT